jgi:DNA-binding transcriptional regulator YiaG
MKNKRAYNIVLVVCWYSKVNKEDVKMQELREFISQLNSSYKDLASICKATQNSVLNSSYEQNKKQDEMLNRIKNIEQQLNKLEGDVRLVNKDGVIKKSYKDYTPEEVYNIRYKTSLAKAARILNCSKSTVQNICKQYVKEREENANEIDINLSINC